MPSIIDRIKEAETQASVIRKEAAKKAKDVVAAANAQAAQTLSSARDESRRANREAAERAELAGADAANGILASRRREADAVCNAAREKLPDAAAYILEEVIKA